MKIKIKKGDYNRVLLTDVLPYEVPILFSNEDFYHIINMDDLPSEFKDLFSTGTFKSTVPYIYKIKKASRVSVVWLLYIQRINSKYASFISNMNILLSIYVPEVTSLSDIPIKSVLTIMKKIS